MMRVRMCACGPASDHGSACISVDGCHGEGVCARAAHVVLPGCMSITLWGAEG